MKELKPGILCCVIKLYGTKHGTPSNSTYSPSFKSFKLESLSLSGFLELLLIFIKTVQVHLQNVPKIITIYKYT